MVRAARRRAAGRDGAGGGQRAAGRALRRGVRFDADRDRSAARARRSTGRRICWREASRPDLLVGEAPPAARRAARGWVGRALDRAAGGRAARAGAARPGGPARRSARGSSAVAGLGAGLRPAGRGAGTLGDGAWTPPTGFGRQSRLTPRRSSRSSGGRSAIRGARRSFREALTSPWTFGLVAESGARRRRLPDRPRGGGHGRGAQPRGRARVPPARHRRRAARGGPGRVAAPEGGRGVSRGSRIQHLGPGAVPGPRLPAGGPARGVLPQSAARTRWCCGWSWSSVRECRGACARRNFG